MTWIIPSFSIIRDNPARNLNISFPFIKSPDSSNSLTFVIVNSRISFPMTCFRALATTNNDAKYGILGGSSSTLLLISYVCGNKPIVYEFVNSRFHGICFRVFRNDTFSNIINIIGGRHLRFLQSINTYQQEILGQLGKSNLSVIV